MKYANLKPEKLLALCFEKKKRSGYFGNFIWKYNGTINEPSTPVETIYSFNFIDRYTGNKYHRLCVDDKGRTIEEMAKVMIHLMKTSDEWGSIPEL